MDTTETNLTLRVQRIQRFCLHDGPGIRTTVFAQGCGLRCWWCHNPQTHPPRGAGSRGWPIGALADELERDRRFFDRSGGGVTLCGGEPLLQPDAAAALLAELGRRGVHRTIDTAGHAPRRAVEQAAPHADLWLWDIKHTDADRFFRGTGGDVRRPLDNLRWLLRNYATPVRVRVPVIAGFNDDPEAISGIGDLLASLPRAVEMELLRGHDTGRDPQARGARSSCVSDERFHQAGRLLDAMGLSVGGVPAAAAPDNSS